MKNKHLYNYLNYILPVLIFLTLLTYYKRFPTGDDAWFAEQSYWLAKAGIIRSNFFSGLLFWEQQILVCHKFFILLGAFVFKAFGISLYAFKSLSLFFEFILMGLFYVYIRSRNLPKKLIVWILFLIFGNISLVTMSFENRPEIILMTFGFCSFLCLNNKNWFLTVLAGLFSGLAILTHLNGVVYLIAGFCTLIYLKRWSDLFIYLFASLAISSLYFYDVFASNNFDLWFYQFTKDPAVIKSLGLKNKLLILVKFPLIFVGSFKEVGVTLILLILLFINKHKLNHLPKNLIVYLLSAIFTFWLITKSITGFYQLLFLPFIIVLILELINYVDQEYVFNKLAIFIFFLYTFICVFGQIQIINKNHSNGYLPDKYAELSKNIPNKSIGVVPLNFFFNDYNKYGQLYCLENIFPLNVYGKTNSLNELSSFAIKRKAQFIVINKKTLTRPFEINSKSIIPNYRLSYSDNEIYVFLKL